MVVVDVGTGEISRKDGRRRSCYEIAEEPIRDEPDGRVRVIWRPAGTVTPPLYPDGVAALAAQAAAG